MDLTEYLMEQIRKPVSNELRHRYRMDLIKTIISNYPEGQPIGAQELRLACNYNGSGIYQMLDQMLKYGEISRKRENTGGAYSYKVIKPANSYKVELNLKNVEKLREQHQSNYEGETMDEEFKDEPNLPIEETTQPPDITFYSLDVLEREAMRYSFYSHGNRDVGDFLMWLGDQNE